MKRILIIGSGGREHAIVWSIQETATEPFEIFCVPGNAGIEQSAQVANISVNDLPALAEFAQSKGIDLEGSLCRF